MGGAGVGHGAGADWKNRGPAGCAPRTKWGHRRALEMLQKPGEAGVLQFLNLVLNIIERELFLAVINLTQKSNTKQIYSSKLMPSHFFLVLH